MHDIDELQLVEVAKHEVAGVDCRHLTGAQLLGGEEVRHQGVGSQGDDFLSAGRLG